MPSSLTGAATVMAMDQNLTSNNRNVTNEISAWSRQEMVIVFALLSVTGVTLNIIVLVYIIVKKMYKNFVSSHFIAHLCLANILACGYLLPTFIHNLSTGGEMFHGHNVICTMHGFTSSAIYSVIYYMTTCVAGVHLLTFARIHYDQLFGLPPSVCCLLSWVIGFSLGLPCLTNYDIIKYDDEFFLCHWQKTYSGFKFLAYVVLLGVILPIFLTLYAYVRILGIFYHSPIVFQALGLYRSRFLVYGFLILPFCQVPYYILRFVPSDPIAYPVSVFISHLICIIGPIPYGLSLFMMKEEDMALMARSHKATYGAPGSVPPQEL